ncbi:hypothetical protein CASFOL_042132 [Castilleja foliolosa]|uniref:Uncharacterized protein n=1 Tax=Castilleja foliolosa TaxID=1961234 RepID=A0ABD3BA52_9LAMI
MASRAIQPHVKTKRASKQKPQPCPSTRTTENMLKNFNAAQKMRIQHVVTSDKSVENVDQKGKFVEPSSSLATTATKDITMERKLPAWNVASSSRQSASQPPDDIDLELSLQYSASVSYYTRCLDKLLASVESTTGLPNPKPDGPIVDPGPNLKRFKLEDSNAQLTKSEEKTTKLFGTIIKTSSEQASDEPGSKVTMPIERDESDGEVNVSMWRDWVRGWVHNRGKFVTKPEEVVTGPKSWKSGPRGSPERDHEEKLLSVEDKARMGRDVNGSPKTGEIRKIGGVTIWNFGDHEL